MTGNSLEKFTEEVKKSWGPLTSETVENCQRLLKKLAQAPLEELGELYRDSEHGFVLLAYAEEEGTYRVPHDHGSGWVIYAVQSGEMEMGTYSRTINQKGQLSLVRRESFRMRPGDCKVFLPGDIHDTRCISPSALILRFTSCDLKDEDRAGRMIRYSGSSITSRRPFAAGY